MNEIQKVSLKSLKLGTVVVHAKLIFLYFQISAKQNCYGFTRGDYLELFPGIPGNSGNRGNPTRGDHPTRGDLPSRGDLPCRVSEKGGSREATSLLSSWWWMMNEWNPKSFFKIAETWHSCCSCQVNIFVFPDFQTWIGFFSTLFEQNQKTRKMQ